MLTAELKNLIKICKTHALQGTLVRARRKMSGLDIKRTAFKTQPAGQTFVDCESFSFPIFFGVRRRTAHALSARGIRGWGGGGGGGLLNKVFYWEMLRPEV